MFKELFTEKEKFIKGEKYKITALDENGNVYQEPIVAIYKGTGKGKQSPNKGKDVYVFDNNGERLAVGFWEVKQKFVKIEKV